ncbi:MAG TPA: hypothetical protein VH416_07895 [Gaiellaceae bacterium]|jgi:hypothetical protein
MRDIGQDPSDRITSCFSCGTPLEGMLERLGSLRCDACREAGARLDPRLVLQQLEQPPADRGHRGR